MKFAFDSRIMAMPANRMIYHLMWIGLLGGTAFALGMVFDTGSHTTRFLLPLSALMLYIVVRLSLRLRTWQNLKSERAEQAAEESRQAESLASLISLIEPQLPLPPTRGWAMSPDILLYVAKSVLNHRPAYVVEASSGTSTIVIAHCLKQLGAGYLLSLEHDDDFVYANQKLLAEHGLSQFAQIVHAPLETHDVRGEQLMWYALDSIDFAQPIDMLIIDGPPAQSPSDRLTRFPAVPLLYGQLSDGCKIVLDDAYRDQEREVVQRWLEQFPNLSHELIECDKGASILIKGATACNVVD